MSFKAFMVYSFRNDFLSVVSKFDLIS